MVLNPSTLHVGKVFLRKRMKGLLDLCCGGRSQTAFQSVKSASQLTQKTQTSHRESHSLTTHRIWWGAIFNFLCVGNREMHICIPLLEAHMSVINTNQGEYTWLQNKHSHCIVITVTVSQRLPTLPFSHFVVTWCLLKSYFLQFNYIVVLYFIFMNYWHILLPNQSY